jgi:hypothetical protein
MRRRALRAVVVVLGAVAVVGAVTAQSSTGTVIGRPDLSLRAVEEVTWGATDLPLVVSNPGLVFVGGPRQFEDRVTTARGVRISVRERDLNRTVAEAVTFERDALLAGLVPRGTSGPFEYGLRIDADLPPGEYTLPLLVTYDHTSMVTFTDEADPEYVDRTRRVTTGVTVGVADRPRIVVEALPDQSVAAGTFGRYTFEVSNEGTATARDLGLRLRTDGVSVVFGGETRRGSSVALFVESLAPGESVTVTVAVFVPPETPAGRYLVTASGTYALDSGVDATFEDRRLGLNVTAANRATGTDTTANATEATSTGTETTPTPTEAASNESGAVGVSYGLL